MSFCSFELHNVKLVLATVATTFIQTVLYSPSILPIEPIHVFKKPIEI